MTAVGTQTQVDDRRAEGAGRSRFSPALGVEVPEGCGLSFRTIPDAPFGVEVHGLQWAGGGEQLGDEGVRLVTLALRRHLLVVLRGQPSPTETDLDGFVRRFGRLVLETEDGRAHYSSHLNKEGPASQMALASRQYMNRAADNSGSTRYTPGADGISELVWHNDQSHRPMLKVMSVLELVEAEDSVVPTEFRDTYTAYETLDPATRAEPGHRQVVYFDPRLPPPAEMPRLADATHPVFQPHPHTGRHSLYVNDFADRIVGMNRATSDAALAGLRAHLATSAPRYVHRWQVGDLLLWDNIGLQHRRDEVPGRQLRTLRQHGGQAE